MARQELRLLEHLIAKGDAEGMTILIPGLTIEQAKYYINKNIEDYNIRCERSKNSVQPDNTDLDIAHYQRMQELLSGNFGLESANKPKTM